MVTITSVTRSDEQTINPFQVIQTAHNRVSVPEYSGSQVNTRQTSSKSIPVVISSAERNPPQAKKSPKPLPIEPAKPSTQLVKKPVVPLGSAKAPSKPKTAIAAKKNIKSKVVVTPVSSKSKSNVTNNTITTVTQVIKTKIVTTTVVQQVSPNASRPAINNQAQKSQPTQSKPLNKNQGSANKDAQKKGGSSTVESKKKPSQGKPPNNNQRSRMQQGQGQSSTSTQKSVKDAQAGKRVKDTKASQTSDGQGQLKIAKINANVRMIKAHTRSQSTHIKQQNPISVRAS